MIKENILNSLLEDFKKPRLEFGGENYITRRREWFDKPMEKIRPLLEKDKLERLSVEEAQRIYNEMTVGGPKLYPRSFIENGVEKIRRALTYLLYGSGPLEERFFNFIENVNSEYFLKGVGKAFASTALFLYNHKEYAVWNGAIDGGLRKLELLPGKTRGESVGQIYLKIIKSMKDLQKYCGFEDLSITDEFVELIFHEKIGGNVLGEPEPPIEPPIEEPPKEEDIHLKIQWMMVKIGIWEGYDVWVAGNDRNKSYNNEKFSDLCLAELPQLAGPEVLKIARSIDVIWFRKRSSQPVRFFEIEHTSSVYSGLLRLNDVKIDYPLPKATIIADTKRKNLYDSQISRRTFQDSELAEVCDFMSYDDIKKWFDAEKVVHKLRKA